MTYDILATGSSGNAVMVPKIGQRVRVRAGCVPTSSIWEYDGDLETDYFDGEVVSIRLNRKGISFKVGIRAEWSGMYWAFDKNLGYSVQEIGPIDSVKYFSFCLSSIGKTVFVEDGA